MNPLDPASAEAGAPNRLAACSTAKFAHSLWGLIHAGATLPQALDAIAAQRQNDGEAHIEVYTKIAYEVRNNGLPLFAALQTVRPFFSTGVIAATALGNLSGLLFKTFVQHLAEHARHFSQLPRDHATVFPMVPDERREFFFYLGHLLVQRAPPDEVHRWLPLIFSPSFRGDIAYLLMRFYEKGLTLSQALRLSKHFQDDELITQVEAAETLDLLAQILLEVPDWLDQRRRLDEQLRYVDMLRSPTAGNNPPDTRPNQS